MIRLSETKVDERYNIDDNGIITDLNGIVQQTKKDIYEYFKKVAVHKILMWTRFGYKNTKIWSIHHIDKNPLNNSLSNLVFLTNTDHTILHNKTKKNFLGKHHSEETKKKLSEMKLGEKNPMFHAYGEKNPMFGRRHSEESKRKMSEAKKGRIPWNKGKKKGIDF